LTIPYLGLVNVNEKYRSKGVGSAMIRFLAEHLIKQGHKVLYSSSQSNEPEPQEWHRAVGFEECGYIAGINPPPDVFAKDPERVYAGRRGIGEIFFRKMLRSVADK
jgi:ribosomal protein S18 acetylase RimI-like enzyme